MPEGAIKALDMIGLSGFFTDGVMAFGWKYVFIGRPEIRIADGTLSINGWQGFPECLRPLVASIPDMDPDNLAGIPVDSQPNPLFVITIFDKRPQFVTLDGQPSLTLFWLFPKTGG